MIELKKSLVMIATPTIILVIIAFLLGGSDLVKEGLQVSMNTIINSALMLVASFVVIGQLQVLINKRSTRPMATKIQWSQRYHHRIHRRRLIPRRTLCVLSLHSELQLKRDTLLHVNRLHTRQRCL